MNERIKKLWEESQQWNRSDDGRGGLKILESVDKFAELIVRECIEQASIRKALRTPAILPSINCSVALYSAAALPYFACSTEISTVLPSTAVLNGTV